MVAQNESPETVVRLVRGTVEGESTDIPGAYRVEKVDEQALAEGRIWPQSRGSQLAALCVGSRDGERTLDLCAAPGGKATMLAGEVTAVELHPGRARELEENARRLGATNVTVVCADGLALPAELDGFDRALVDAPCSGLGTLASAPRPALARRAAARAPARPRARRGRAGEARWHRPLLRLHDRRRRERGRRRRVRARRRAARRRVARVPAPAAAGVPAHPAAP